MRLRLVVLVSPVSLQHHGVIDSLQHNRRRRTRDSARGRYSPRWRPNSRDEMEHLTMDALAQK